MDRYENLPDSYNYDQRKLDSTIYDPRKRLDTELVRVGRINSFETNTGRSKPNVIGSFSVSDFDDLDKVGSLGDTEICSGGITADHKWLSRILVDSSEGLDIGLVYWYHKLVDPPESYKQFLDYLTKFSRKPYPALGQFTGFKAWVHENGCRLILPEIDTETYNPADKFQSIRSSASRTAKQLTNLRWLPSANENKKALVNLDLTFPSEVSDKLYGGVGDLDKRFWSVYKSFLEKFNSNVANSSNLHLWSSEDPLSPNAHFHSSVVWAKDVVPDVAESSNKILKPLEWHDKGKPVNPAKIKSLWAEAINKEFGTNYCSDKVAYENGTTWLNSIASGGSVSPVVVNSSWIPLSPGSWSVRDKDDPQAYIKKKVIHRLKYCRRKPLTDLGEYFTENKFSEDMMDVGFAIDLVDYGNSSRQFGLWTRLKECVNVQDSVDDPKDLCPVCGSEVVDVYPVPVDAYQPDKLVRIGKRGTVYRGDPPNPPPENDVINLNTQPAVSGSPKANGEVEKLEVI